MLEDYNGSKSLPDVDTVDNSGDNVKTLVLKAILMAFLAFPMPCSASHLFGDVAQFGDQGNIRAFAKDIGGIIGSGTYLTGRILGFAGFAAGFQYAYQFRPDAQNQVLKRSGIEPFGFPWFQAEIGLPLKFDGFIRGFSYEGMTMAGGGLRYGIFTVTDLPGAPQALLALDGESFVHTAFSGSHFGANAVLSVTFPYFKPYVGGGLDRTRFIVKQSADPTLLDQVILAYGSRFSAGVSMNPFPFTFVNVAYVHRHGDPGLQVGGGARF